MREVGTKLLFGQRVAVFITENLFVVVIDIRSIDDTTPDKRLYPEFDEILKRSMLAETEGFVAEGCLEVECCAVSEVLTAFVHGSSNRTVRAHQLNQESSRSHSV